MSATGFIYILSNPSFEELKIGQTATDPKSRAAQLYTTGVPTPFSLAYYALVDDYENIERKTHLELEQFRHNTSREFFVVDLKTAINAIRRAAGEGLKFEEQLQISEEEGEPIPGDNEAVRGVGLWAPDLDELENVYKKNYINAWDLWINLKK